MWNTGFYSNIVPETDHIQWNIGYIFVLSLIFSFFIHIPNKLPKGIKYII